ncbi:hypothetical protein ACQEVI_25785 [Promicromonospora sp. CA-289599]|uniref:hypothetical protein n=1 Tax=Promicromonospora sp. CA-289599 TaxID=3240014 RepID=UPI003D90FEAA
MSESDPSRNDAEFAELAERQAEAVRAQDPDPDDTDARPADEKAIPGEHPEDNPDKDGEDRFDAG